MAKQTFEKAMDQLEQIVQKLETGELSLEDSIKKFEEGVKLSNYCYKKLDETEKKVTLLLKSQEGQIFEEPFDPESSEDNIEE